MGYSAEYLTNEEWLQLQAAYRLHGNGPGFWQVYQDLLQAAAARNTRTALGVANELARIAERMGATQKAVLLAAADISKRGHDALAPH
ncbi:hypothetical protein [Stenotrophomonas acidaminiphila]|uniref:hypothetical protein n=1 Tax=Stenotrophomonas acidaminiphila TaxID=128780 RepID=UPI0028A7BA50|nr:hypothetical protein [Stenotrophomonas acidaminiphila]